MCRKSPLCCMTHKKLHWPAPNPRRGQELFVLLRAVLSEEGLYSLDVGRQVDSGEGAVTGRLAPSSGRTPSRPAWAGRKLRGCDNSLLGLVDLLIVIRQLWKEHRQRQLCVFRHQHRCKQHRVHAAKQTYILPVSLSLRNCWCMAFIFCSSICIFWQLWRVERSGFKGHTSVRPPPPPAPPPEYLFSLASTSASLACSICRWSRRVWNSLIPAAYIGKCSWTCRGRRPQNRVCVRLWPLILDYKLGHSCQCKHLHCRRGAGRRWVAQVCVSRLQLNWPEKVHHLLIHFLLFMENLY